MQEEFLNQIADQLKQGMTEFLAQTDLKKNDIFVLGCSTSEIQGKKIGKYSNLDVGRTVIKTLTEILPSGVQLAVQGCEHLNRALAMERLELFTLEHFINLIDVKVDLFCLFFC
ncbi:TIGR01440 family protein [Pediococcus acidilactici D3]|nr:TIGR01440 family protein [Pediococcus acidilactici D3]